MLGPTDLNRISSMIDPNSAPAAAAADYIIEHLDYQYISSSTDIPYLQLLSSVLSYLLSNPDLEKKVGIRSYWRILNSESQYLTLVSISNLLLI